MARTAPATPTRRVTRSSSRKAPADDSADEHEQLSTTRQRSNARSKSPVKKSAAAGKSPAKKSPAKPSTPTRRAGRPVSSSRKASAEDSDEEQAPRRRRSVAANNNKKTPEKKKSAPRSRSRTSKKDQEDEEDHKKAKSPVKKSPVKAAPKKIRTRSRSGGRKAPQSDSEDEDEEVIKKAPQKVVSPAKKVTKKVESESEQDDEEEEPTAVMYRAKVPTVIVKPIDYFWLALIGFIPLLASAINMIHVSPIIREYLENRCAKFAILNNLANISLFNILIANFFLYLLTAVLIAFKLRKSSTEAFVTTTITSMIFRLFVSGAILLTWCGLHFCKRHIPEFILQIISISLFASSLADLFYSFNSSSVARIFENVFAFAISYYMLFQAPAASNLAVRQLSAPLLSSLILYAVVAVLIALGSVGVLSTSNTTHTSKTVTAISHGCIWLHTIIAIVGPIVFFFKEVQQHLVANFSKPAIIARAVAVTAAVLLNFTSYADAVSVNLNAKKD